MVSQGAFHRILVPLEFVLANRDADESEELVEAGGQALILPQPAKRCLELAGRLAEGGAIRLLHATPLLTMAGIYGGPEGTWMPPDTVAELDRQAERSSLAVLRDLAARHLSGCSVEYQTRPGDPVDVILTEARAFNADLVILSTSGRGRARRFFLGSTADKVIRQASCEVLVVPGCTSETSSETS